MIIREATIKDVNSIAEVHYKTWITTYRGLVPESLLDSLSAERSTRRFKDKLDSLEKPQFILVAENKAGEIVGFTHGGPERNSEKHNRGEIYAIYVLKNSQNLGVGTALFEEAAKLLRNADFNIIIIWVLKDNKYQKFYEKLGGIATGSKTDYFGGHKLDEISYTFNI